MESLSTATTVSEPVINEGKSVRLCPWRENLYGLVSLWDMITFDAGRLCTAMMFLSSGQVFGALGQLSTKNANSEFNDLGSAGEFLDQVGRVCDYCAEMSFPMTRIPLARILELAANSAGGTYTFSVHDYSVLLSNSMERLRDEAKTKLFLLVPQERTKFYSDPRDGWREIIARFPETDMDIEEAAICFALDRYAACVFHCVQIVEVGLIALGTFIGVKDPKSGWTATTNALDAIIKKRHDDLTAFESHHIVFLKQVHATVTALQDAWRNKISHAQGRLQVMTTDFSLRVAEEILIASRGFMRRLSTDLP
jgi:hypothetical protein